jgi:CMP-N-acetylneuraminic acid synthetase
VAPEVYEQVASVYVFKPEYLRTSKGLLEGRCQGYLMPRERSLDVDDELDFKLIEFLMKEKLGLRTA